MDQETQIAISEFNKRMHALSYTLSEGEHIVIRVTSPESKQVSYLSPTCHLGSAAIYKLSQLENTKEFKETSTLVVECFYDASDIISYNVLEQRLKKIHSSDEKEETTDKRIDELKLSLSVVDKAYQLFTSVDLEGLLEPEQIRGLFFEHAHLNLHQLESLRKMSLEQFKQIDIEQINAILLRITSITCAIKNPLRTQFSLESKLSSQQFKQSLSPEIRLIHAAKNKNMQLQHLEKPHEQLGLSKEEFKKRNEGRKKSELCALNVYGLLTHSSTDKSPISEEFKLRLKKEKNDQEMKMLAARLDSARRAKYFDQQRKIFPFSTCTRFFDERLRCSHRNKHWAEKLPSMLKENPCYVAVGFAHLLSSRKDDGVDSLPKLLIQAGLTLTPIKSTFLNRPNNQSDQKHMSTQNNDSLSSHAFSLPIALDTNPVSVNKTTSLINLAKKLYCATSWQYNQCWRSRNKEKAFLTIEQKLSEVGSTSDAETIYYAQSLITCTLFCRSTSFTAWLQNYKTRSSNTVLDLLNTARVDASNELYWLAQLINADSDITREDLFDFANNGVFEPADFAKKQEKDSYYQTIFNKPVVSP